MWLSVGSKYQKVLLIIPNDPISLANEHDILVIGDEGAENITGFPFGPEHNIIKAQ